ncbi:Nuc-1 negative regulatory protein preg [Drechmeria coniospora]|uniref:Nuc-1 negative regulatory protein preg n=1 Tax=Drechmeria coniospora TaxID=98403 RepID=A0A151GVN5_DRECN|nr:Nuc-1 negative regulatory protein preg [Drechmeria coniospora]KYK61169.1 Nuc-1 negative regulatory protein preg [Drechmeria coniospora]ODA80935.1 hypothetical protein RJ55_03895 [Drechmeria coniospora]
MLTTSPILAGSANTSSARFHPGRTESPSPKPRRPSPLAVPAPNPSASASARPLSPSRRRTKPSSAVVGPTASPDGPEAHEPPGAPTEPEVARQTVPGRRATGPASSGDIPAVAAPAGSADPGSADPGPADPSLSPSKRRGSVCQNVGASDEAAPSTSKRTKPDEQPAKLLPLRYELCAVEDIVELIAHMLGELIATNDSIRISSGGLTRFHSRTPPGISVRDYLHRLAKHATLAPPLLLAMVYYIDRLCALYPEFTINTLTVHRFLITAGTVAAKGLSDSFWNNTTYARVGGVRVAELKLLELEFLYRVDWKIVPNPEVLVAYYRGLVERAPGYELEPDSSSEDGLDDDDE